MVRTYQIAGRKMDMKAAIYCRLSEEDKTKLNPHQDSISIQNQKTMLIQYAIEQGWEIYNIYSDDDYTGADRNRPQFNLLLDDAKKHKFDIVLCKTQSRFTRELELVERYIHHLFPIWGIRFVSIVDNADTNNKGNKKSRQINGLVNEWYLEDMSDNIKSVLTARRKNGLHIGSFALYGYIKDSNNKGHIIIDTEAAQVVRQIFTLFALGYGKTAIARILNEKGIPNPTEYKRLKGLNYKQPATGTATLWQYSTIAKILKNEIYIGNMVQGKYGSISYKTKQNKPRPQNSWYIVENTHEPIIDLSLWDKVQAILKERTKPFKCGNIGVFANKVKCGYCGSTMRSTKSNGKYYLQCTTHYFSPNNCEGTFISVSKLENILKSRLKQFSEEYLDFNLLQSQLNPTKNLYEQQNQLKAKISEYKKQLTNNSKILRELYIDKANGSINSEFWNSMLEDITNENEQLNTRLKESQTNVNELEVKIDEFDFESFCKQQTTGENLNRAIIDGLIEYICVKKRIPGTRDVPIEIYWKF